MDDQTQLDTLQRQVTALEQELLSQRQALGALEQLRRDIEALHGRLNLLEQAPLAGPRPADVLGSLQARAAALEGTPQGDDIAELRALTHAVQAELSRLTQATDTISNLETRLRGLEAKAVS